MRAELVTDFIVIILVRIIVENPASMFSATRLMHETTDFVVLACPESPDPAIVTILLPEDWIDVSFGIEGRNKIISMARRAVGKFPGARKIQQDAVPTTSFEQLTSD
jgi:hypothetical protein